MNYNLFLKAFFKKNLLRYFPLLQNTSFCNCPHREAQSPSRQCRRSFADALGSDWNPKDQTSSTARRSQRSFRNYNRSCWLPHSWKSGLYLRFACIQSCSNFSFSQLKNRFSSQYYQTASLNWEHSVPNPQRKMQWTYGTMRWTWTEIWPAVEISSQIAVRIILAGSMPKQVLSSFPQPPPIQIGAFWPTRQKMLPLDQLRWRSTARPARDRRTEPSVTPVQNSRLLVVPGMVWVPDVFRAFILRLFTRCTVTNRQDVTCLNGWWFF